MSTLKELSEFMPIDLAVWLVDKKIPMCIKTEYKNGKPSQKSFLTLKLTKKDQFFRLNNKIVSSHLARYAFSEGVAQF